MNLRERILAPVFGPPGDVLAKRIRAAIARDAQRNFAAARIEPRPFFNSPDGAKPSPEVYREYHPDPDDEMPVYEDDLRGETYRDDPEAIE
jgi:hypothetical protein